MALAEPVPGGIQRMGIKSSAHASASYSAAKGEIALITASGLEGKSAIDG